MKPDLANNGTANDIRDFVVAVVGLAAQDHAKNVKPRSGKEIILLCAGPSRHFHDLMATNIYNKTRLTLDCMGS